MLTFERDMYALCTTQTHCGFHCHQRVSRSVREQESDSTHTLAGRGEKFFVFPFSGQIDVNCFRDIRLIGGMNLNLNLLLKYQ